LPFSIRNLALLVGPKFNDVKLYMKRLLQIDTAPPGLFRRMTNLRLVPDKLNPLAISALLSAMSLAAQAQFSYTTLDYPSTTSGTTAYGISGNNIVGFYVGNDASHVRHGFVYNGSTYTTLDNPNAFPSFAAGTTAYGISGNNIVGGYASSVGHGFLYNGTTYTTLDNPLGVTGTEATGISGNNIVGNYNDAGGHSHGFLYNGSTYTTLDNPLGVNGTFAQGISGNNIVGYYWDLSGFHGFLYNGSSFATLTSPLGSDVIPYGISGNKIVGSSEDGHGFFYDGNTYITLDDPLGVQGTTATGISGDTITGFFTDFNGTHSFVVTVPEPSTLALAAIGGAALIFRWKRKRSTGAATCLPARSE